MIVSAGSRLGPYEIVSRIGAGGMGEVWRAKDPRLGRDVAIKVLPSDFASNAQLRSRFEREARAISRLNHPNICTIHDVGHDNGVDFLVLELLEGESLADRLVRGALPFADVVRFGVQVSEALERAHRAGIIHRDLKPGNVMLTPTGAKLLDFGLAKDARVLNSLPEGSDGPTEAKPLTVQGTIVGTLQYMSPEQLEGAELDSRSDIFSLGSLLYEMATGHPAFDAKTKPALIAAIVGGEPARMSTLQPLAPPALEHIIGRCLKKDRAQRWQSARDIAEELKWIGEAGSGASRAATVSRRPSNRVLLAIGALGIAAVIASGIAAWTFSRALDLARQPLQFEVVAPVGQAIVGAGFGAAVVSPDGERIAFVTSKETTFRLWVRDLTSKDAREIFTAPSSISFPFWSPDSESLGFFSDGKLKRISARGGAVQSLADAHSARGGSWNQDDVIVFAPEVYLPLMRVPASGGAAVPAAKLPADRWTQRLPSFLPDGNHFLYVERGAQRSLSGRLMLGSLDGLPPKLLIEQASNASFTRGQLFYVAGGNLLARAFDPDRLEFAGAPIPIAQDIEANYFAVGDFSVSASTLVYRPTVRIRSRLVRITRDGRQSPASDQTGYFVSLTMSRDGGKVVVTRSDEGTDSRDLWLLDLGRAQLTRVTFFSSIGNPAGVFSPDGSRLAVSADTRETSKAPSLSIQQVSGMGSAEAIPVDDGFTVNDWSADGRFLLGVQESAKALDVSYLDLQDRKTRRLVTGPTHESMPRISPEGRWLAYVSNESGRSEVYVTDFPNAGQKWQVSKNGGVAPQWSSGGRELWFRSWDAIYVCAVATGPHGIELGEAEQLMRLDHDASIAAAPDGSYAIVTQPLEMQVPAPLEVVRNWTVPSIRSGGN